MSEPRMRDYGTYDACLEAMYVYQREAAPQGEPLPSVVAVENPPVPSAKTWWLTPSVKVIPAVLIGVWICVVAQLISGLYYQHTLRHTIETQQRVIAAQQRDIAFLMERRP